MSTSPAVARQHGWEQEKELNSAPWTGHKATQFPDILVPFEYQPHKLLTVLILFQPFVTFLLFHFISLLFIILLDSILLSLVKYFLESYELLCFHYYLY